MERAKFKNLRIRAYLQTPIISDNFLPIDSILFAVKCRKMLPPMDFTLSKENHVKEVANIQLPIIKRCQNNDFWYYSSSFAQFGNVKESKSFKVKQADWIRNTKYLDESTKRIDTKRGKFKPYHINFFVKTVDYIDWYCVAEPNEITELLNFVTHIGKDTNIGYGQVQKWEIEEWHSDWSERNDQNKLMRNVPLYNQEGKGFLYGIRPSYWLPKHQFICKMP